MKKLLAALAAIPLIFAMGACSGDSASDEPTAAATTAAAEPTEATEAATDDAMAGSAVEDYCANVDDYVVEAQKLLEDPTSVDTQALQDKAQELSDAATQLTQELIDDPSKAAEVQECTKKLQEVLGN